MFFLMRNSPFSITASPKEPKRTLTNLYNLRPDWVTEVHRRLDAAVFAAYGWPADLSDDEILARLLTLNVERAACQNAASSIKEMTIDED